MIESLSVKGLNNRIDADFEFNEDLNIITGKNGSGKTTLLKLLWYLISGNLARIPFEVPFQSVSINTSMFSLSLEQDSPYAEKCTAYLVEYELRERYRKEFGREYYQDLTLEFTLDDVRILNRSCSSIAEMTKRSLFFPSFRRIEGGYVSRGNIDNPEWKMTSGLEKLQDSMEDFSSGISRNGHRFIASISTNDIGQLLEQKYGDIHIRISNLQSKVLDDISQKIQVSAGGEIESATSQATPTVLNEIQQLADERDRLRRPFVALSELTQNILQYQAIRVSGRSARDDSADGITLGEETGETALGTVEEAIASDKLSSGEKQMLSFLCYNAFSENTAIFIDEPELSLHVDWQRLLLPTLLEQGTGNQFFIATHSPFIYAKYPDKEIPLGED